LQISLKSLAFCLKCPPVVVLFVRVHIEIPCTRIWRRWIKQNAIRHSRRKHCRVVL